MQLFNDATGGTVGPRFEIQIVAEAMPTAKLTSAVSARKNIRFMMKVFYADSFRFVDSDLSSE